MKEEYDNDYYDFSRSRFSLKMLKTVWPETHTLWVSWSISGPAWIARMMASAKRSCSRQSSTWTFFVWTFIDCFATCCGVPQSILTCLAPSISLSRYRLRSTPAKVGLPWYFCVSVTYNNLVTFQKNYFVWLKINKSSAKTECF